MVIGPLRFNVALAASEIIALLEPCGRISGIHATPRTAVLPSNQPPDHRDKVHPERTTLISSYGRLRCVRIPSVVHLLRRG